MELHHHSSICFHEVHLYVFTSDGFVQLRRLCTRKVCFNCHAQKLLLGVYIHNTHLQMVTIIRLLLLGCFAMCFHSKIYNNSQTKSNLIKYWINKSYLKVLFYFKLLKSNFIGLYRTEVLML